MENEPPPAAKAGYGPVWLRNRTGGRIHRSPTENSAPDFSNIEFGGLGLLLTVGVLGSIDPHHYPYPNNNPNSNPTLTLIVTLTPN